jgi:hypothetical protein
MDRDYLVNKIQEIQKGIDAAKPLVDNKQAEYLKVAGDYEYLQYAARNLKLLLEEHDRRAHAIKEQERLKLEAAEKAKLEAEKKPEEPVVEVQPEEKKQD